MEIGQIINRSQLEVDKLDYAAEVKQAGDNKRCSNDQSQVLVKRRENGATLITDSESSASSVTNWINPNKHCLVRTAKMMQITPVAESQLSGQVDSSTSKEFKTFVATLLAPDAQGNVHEEQLQNAIVNYLLADKNPEAAKFYAQAFDSLVGGESVEDAVKGALEKTVAAGLISVADAEHINGVSFRAAQLDDNLTALFDNRGSESDQTIAVMSLDQAIERATQTLSAIDSGTIATEQRALDAPSNVVPGSNALAAKGGSSDGFLWKPVSERDRHLVVLFPPSLTGKIESAGIYADLPAANANLIEQGRFSGDNSNGGRAHFRFSKSGGSYPDGVYVVAHLKDGSQVEFKIGNTAARYEG